LGESRSQIRLACRESIRCSFLLSFWVDLSFEKSSLSDV
jgi:hypothetical protein